MRKLTIIWTIAFALMLVYGSIKTMDIYADYMSKRIHGSVYVK